mgnify:FL=1
MAHTKKENMAPYNASKKVTVNKPNQNVMNIYNKGYKVADMYDAFGTKVGDKNTPFIADTAFAPKYTRTPEKRANMKASLEKNFYGGGPEDNSNPLLPPGPLPQGRVQFSPFPVKAPKFNWGENAFGKVGGFLKDVGKNSIKDIFKGGLSFNPPAEKTGIFSNWVNKNVKNDALRKYYGLLPLDALLNLGIAGVSAPLSAVSKAAGYAVDLPFFMMTKNRLDADRAWARNPDGTPRKVGLSTDYAENLSNRLSNDLFGMFDSQAGLSAGPRWLSRKMYEKGLQKQFPDYRDPLKFPIRSSSYPVTIDAKTGVLSKAEIAKLNDAQKLADELYFRNPSFSPNKISQMVALKHPGVLIDETTRIAAIMKKRPSGSIKELDFLEASDELAAPWTLKYRNLNAEKESIEREILGRMNTQGKSIKAPTTYTVDELGGEIVDPTSLSKQKFMLNNASPNEKFLLKNIYKEREDLTDTYGPFKATKVKTERFLTKEQTKTFRDLYPDSKEAIANKRYGTPIPYSRAPSLQKIATTPPMDNSFITARSKIYDKDSSAAFNYGKGIETSLNSQVEMAAIRKAFQNGEINLKEYSRRMKPVIAQFNDTVVHENLHFIADRVGTIAQGASPDSYTKIVKAIKSYTNKGIATSDVLGKAASDSKFDQALFKALQKEFKNAQMKQANVVDPDLFDQRLAMLTYYNNYGEKLARGQVTFGKNSRGGNFHMGTPAQMLSDYKVKIKETIDAIKESTKWEASGGTFAAGGKTYTKKEAIDMLTKELKFMKETKPNEMGVKLDQTHNFATTTSQINKNTRSLSEIAKAYSRESDFFTIDDIVELTLYGPAKRPTQTSGLR